MVFLLKKVLTGSAKCDRILTDQERRVTTMTRTYKKAACTPQPKDIWPCRHTNCRKLRKTMDRIDRRRLNRFTKEMI